MRHNVMTLHRGSAASIMRTLGTAHLATAGQLAAAAGCTASWVRQVLAIAARCGMVTTQPPRPTGRSGPQPRRWQLTPLGRTLLTVLPASAAASRPERAPRRPSLTPEQRRTLIPVVREQYAAGATIAEIAAHHGLGYSTARRLVHDTGLPIHTATSPGRGGPADA